MFTATLFIIAERTVVHPYHEILFSTAKEYVNLYSKRDFAGGSKFANPLILKERNCPGLFRWAPCNHRVLKSREGDRRESQRDRTTENNCQRDENVLALKMEEGPWASRSWKREENRNCARTSRKEGNPADTLILAC